MDRLSELLTATYQEIQHTRQWKNKSRIIGEAVEDCMLTIQCPICNVLSTLVKYTANQKSKDIYCTACHSDFQIKTTKYTSKKKETLTLLGAEYKTTYQSIQDGNIHYLVIQYSESNPLHFTIHDILFIHFEDITTKCVIPRKPLSSTAKRAGWQGCTLSFDRFKSIH
jgi:type II restriction enzyme